MAKTKSITCLSQLSNEILQNIYTVIVYNKQGKKIVILKYVLILQLAFKYLSKNFKSIWTKIRRKQAIDSIQNSSGKPNHQAKDNWETEQSWA